MTGEEMLSALRQQFRLLVDLPPDTYVVGGAVRDLLAGAIPRDLDLASARFQALTSALSRRAGREAIPLGRHELTALRIVDDGRIYDMTPLEAGSIDVDLARRDFAINAIAIDCASGLVLDPFGGRVALTEKRLTLVRQSNLDDDPLRVIKAVRMASRYELSIDENTASALRSRASRIREVAVERVHDELIAILAVADLPRSIELLRLLELDEVIFGQRLQPEDFKQIAGIPFQTSAALAVIHRTSSEAALHDEARHWRWSIEEERRVATLLRDSRRLVIGEYVAIVLYDLGEELAGSFAPLLRGLGADTAAAAVEATIRKRGSEIFATQPLLSGDEIRHLSGLPPGPVIGTLKRAVLEAQLRGEVATRQEAEGLIRSIQT